VDPHAHWLGLPRIQYVTSTGAPARGNHRPAVLPDLSTRRRSRILSASEGICVVAITYSGTTLGDSQACPARPSRSITCSDVWNCFFLSSATCASHRPGDGTYVADPPSKLTIFVTIVEGQLTIEVAGEPKRTLVPVSETQFVAPGVASSWIEFVNGENRIGYQLGFYRSGRHFTALRKTN
jgi:hypothetical protein